MPRAEDVANRRAQLDGRDARVRQGAAVDADLDAERRDRAPATDHQRARALGLQRAHHGGHAVRAARRHARVGLCLGARLRRPVLVHLEFAAGGARRAVPAARVRLRLAGPRPAAERRSAIQSGVLLCAQRAAAQH